MKEVELVESTLQHPFYDLLAIELDDTGAERWSDATGLAIGGRLAGVIRGRLVSLPLVNAQIDGGRMSFPLGEHGKHKNSGLLQVVRAESSSVGPVR